MMAGRGAEGAEGAADCGEQSARKQAVDPGTLRADETFDFTPAINR